MLHRIYLYIRRMGKQHLEVDFMLQSYFNSATAPEANSYVSPISKVTRSHVPNSMCNGTLWNVFILPFAC